VAFISRIRARTQGAGAPDTGGLFSRSVCGRSPRLPAGRAACADIPGRR